jgi:hypothetical protein
MTELKPHQSQLQDTGMEPRSQSWLMSDLRMTQAQLLPLFIQLFDDCPLYRKTTWLQRFDSDVLALGKVKLDKVRLGEVGEVRIG